MATDSSHPEPSSPSTLPGATGDRSWSPLTKIQRRILGVLIEKSKTTPDVYPMTINGIRNGSNQKSNRSPLMDLNEDQIDMALEEMRRIGCVTEVHSEGRVPKYRHLAYEWLGVEKAELSVIAELLLRGEQTLGELRARTARMEQRLEGLDDLLPILQELKRKGLLMELTPKGRGQVVTHNLYPDSERERLENEFKVLGQAADSTDGRQSASPPTAPQGEADRESHQGSRPATPEGRPADHQLENRLTHLEARVAELQNLVQQLKNLIES